MGSFYLNYLFIGFIDSLPYIIAVIVLLVAVDRLFFRFTDFLIDPVKDRLRITSLKKYLELNPENADDLLELGSLYFREKDFEGAEGALLRAKPKMDDNPWLHLYLGMTYADSGNTAEGRQELEKTIRLDEKTGYGLPYIYLLEMELEGVKPSPEKIEGYEDKLSNFDKTENFYILGKLFGKAGDSIRSRDYFRKAVRDYGFYPGGVKKLHRKWFALSLLRGYTLAIAVISAGVVTVVLILTKVFSH